MQKGEANMKEGFSFFQVYFSFCSFLKNKYFFLNRLSQYVSSKVVWLCFHFEFMK